MERGLLRTLGLAVTIAVALAAPAAFADDKWELSSEFNDDGGHGFRTFNQIFHGGRQTHDIQGTAASPDLDWIKVAVKNRRSYEARLSSGSIYMGPPADSCISCTLFDRVTSGNVVLTEGRVIDGSVSNLTVRWIATADNNAEFLRVRGQTFGAPNASDQYDVEFFDTTYNLARWNQSGSQTTVLLIRNTTTTAITGSIFFYAANGSLVATEPLVLAANGLQVLSTGAVAPLAGLSGSAAIVHNGAYGALTGKAVALEPATGFTFDTLIEPVPK